MSKAGTASSTSNTTLMALKILVNHNNLYITYYLVYAIHNLYSKTIQLLIFLYRVKQTCGQPFDGKRFELQSRPWKSSQVFPTYRKELMMVFNNTYVINI